LAWPFLEVKVSVTVGEA